MKKIVIGIFALIIIISIIVVILINNKNKTQTIATINIQVGEQTIKAELYNNPTSKDFLELLPMTVRIWQPAQIAKAFVLPEGLDNSLATTRKYKSGEIAYWPEGTSVALFYNHDFQKTVVPVITMGRILNEQENVLESYEGDIIITIENYDNKKISSQEEVKMNYSNSTINGNTTVQEVVDNPAFNEFGRFIFPIQNRNNYSNMKISDINYLLPYHSHINTDTTIEVISYMLNQVNEGNTIFYNIYSNEEKREDNSKEDTGLFFFKGEPNAPFAIICAGGGFSYVGSIHESYPHALELSKKGYNAFVIQYRADWDKSVEDLAKAISYIFEHAEELQVSTDDYSLWGGSAGARMVAYIGTHGVKYFGGGDYPKPATVIMQYTGHSEVGTDEIPTFAIVGENDGIANPDTMKRRIDILKQMGVDSEFHKYPNLSHGFGLGIGTSAEGWIDDAVSFWEKHIKK